MAEKPEKKGLGAALLIAPKPKTEADEEASEGDLDDAMADLIDAVQAGDSSAAATAFRRAYMHCSDEG